MSQPELRPKIKELYTILQQLKAQGDSGHQIEQVLIGAGIHNDYARELLQINDDDPDVVDRKLLEIQRNADKYLTRLINESMKRKRDGYSDDKIQAHLIV